MSIGAISASGSITINGQTTPQNQTAATGTAAAAPTTTSLSAAAMKEATETAADTAKEAQHGDRQAQKLLQKQHAQSVTAAAPPPGVVNGHGQITGEIINTKA